jgi:hypothetical protein
MDRTRRVAQSNFFPLKGEGKEKTGERKDDDSSPRPFGERDGVRGMQGRGEKENGERA